MAIIYKLKVGDEEYIGRTNNLRRRVIEHKCRAKAGLKGKLYQAIRDNNLTFSYEEVEVCPDNLAPKLEQFWLLNSKAKLNSNYACGHNHERHKESIMRFRRKQIYCECCGFSVSAPNWAAHTKTKGHQKLISQQNVYDSLDGFSKKICEGQQHELCESDERP